MQGTLEINSSFEDLQFDIKRTEFLGKDTSQLVKKTDFGKW